MVWQLLHLPLRKEAPIKTNDLGRGLRHDKKQQIHFGHPSYERQLVSIQITLHKMDDKNIQPDHWFHKQ
jgi:hypothetical protein